VARGQSQKLTVAQQVAALAQAAPDFTPASRAESMIKKWIRALDGSSLSDQRLWQLAEHATHFAADVLVGQPSPNGKTAFDRAGQSLGAATPILLQALGALRKSRYRILRLRHEKGASSVVDLFSGETWRIEAAPGHAAADGEIVFARLVPLGPETACLPCMVTVLRGGLTADAQAHPAAASASLSANLRWAEAVYGDVIRHDITTSPGVAASGDHSGDLFNSPSLLETLTHRWAALHTAPPPDLLRDTRQAATVTLIANAIIGAALTKEHGDAAMSKALTSLARVAMETMLHREKNGIDHETLDDVRQAIDVHIATACAPPASRRLFAELRQSLTATLGVNANAAAADVDLARLMQRIQALRAKTTARGCTEQEAMAAAEKVAELLDRHGLSLGDVDFKAQACEGSALATTRKRAGALDGCVPAIADFFDCRVWLQNEPGDTLRYVFFGLRADVAACLYLYDLVERAFVTETECFRAGAFYASMQGDRRSATNSFQLGMGQGIRTKLAAFKQARDVGTRSTGRDLVVAKAALVEEEIARLGLQLEVRAQNSARRVLSEAYASGKEAGEKFEVLAGVSQAA
jgi:hypothetical protein